MAGLLSSFKHILHTKKCSYTTNVTSRGAVNHEFCFYAFIQNSFVENVWCKCHKRKRLLTFFCFSLVHVKYGRSQLSNDHDKQKMLKTKPNVKLLLFVLIFFTKDMKHKSLPKRTHCSKNGKIVE